MNSTGAPRGADTSGGPAGRRHARRAAWLAGIVVAGVALFWLYWRQARSAAVGSDAASIILQGWDMLHGNLLLHGWITSDVSFYATELVQYMVLQTVLPMSPGLVYVAGAMTYAILVLLAAVLARGRATGREGIVRACIGGGVMLAPALGLFTASLLHAPDHVGSAVPVLLAWLVIDRCRPRWYVPAAVCLLLAWGIISDPLIEITGAAAIAAACAVRSCYRLLRRRSGGREEPASPPWFEPSLAAAAVLSVGVAEVATQAIRAAGGFTPYPLNTGFMGLPGLWQHAAVTVKGLLGLFGAAFWTKDAPTWQLAFDYAHLAGVALVIIGFALALLRLFRADSLLTAGLAAGIILNIAAFMTSKYATNLLSVREVAAVLPFAAVLAGRLIPGHLPGASSRKFAAAGAAAGVLYAGMLGVNSFSARPAPPYEVNVASWLAGHHLRSGLALSYWMSNIVTVDAGNKVTVRDAVLRSGAVSRPGGWEIDTDWYSPSVSTADFLLTDAEAGSGEWKTELRAATRTFGAPAQTYRLDGFTVFTWRYNILTRLHQPRHANA